MNKRYMDFVPKGAERATPRQVEKRPLSGVSAGRVSGNATVSRSNVPLGGVSRGTATSGNATVSHSAMPGMRAPVSMDMRRRVVSHANVKTLPEASPRPATPVRASAASVRELPRTQMILPSQPKATPARRAPMTAKTTQSLAARKVQAPGAQATKTPVMSKKTFTKPSVTEARKQTLLVTEARKQTLLHEQILEDALREAELEEPAPKKSRIPSLSLKSLVRPGEKNRNGKDGVKKDESEVRTPRSPFINTENLDKRPLSGAREVVPEPVMEETEPEEKKGIVTIISKPEKDSRAGLIVAVILTIILGAAAGTIAFLLLPK